MKFVQNTEVLRKEPAIFHWHHELKHFLCVTGVSWIHKVLS